MTQIKVRQNEDSSLSTQYAAQYYFNRAEIYSFLAWFFCLLSLFCVMIPQTAPIVVMFGAPFLIDITAALMILAFNKNVALGARLRAAFDNYVFGFSDKLNMDQTLKEYVIKAIEKHPTQVEIQKKNTGTDSPPGVREWYNTNSKKTGIDAIFSCQKENVWWEKKLLFRRIIFYVFITIICIALLFILNFAGNIHVLQIILSSALLIRTIERIYENVQYFRVGNKIDGQVELLEAQKTKEQLIQLQSTINEKRKLKITGVNFIHKFMANKLSVRYEKTKD